MRWCHFLPLLALLSLCNCPSVVLSPDWLSATDVLCPDRLTSCSLQTSTCCKSSFSSRYLCCPFPNAVCCEDGQHCCPQCFSCNVKGSSCTRPATTAAAVRIAALTSASYNPRAAAAAVAAAKPQQTSAAAAKPKQPLAAAAAQPQSGSSVTKEAETRGAGGIFSGVLSAVRSTFFSSSGKTTSDSPVLKAPPTPSLIDKSQSVNQYKRVNIQQPNVASKVKVASTGSNAKPLPGGVRKVTPIVVSKVASSAGRVTPSDGRVTPGIGRVTPGVGRVSSSGHATVQSSSYISKPHVAQTGHKIAHSKEAPPTHSKQAPPTLRKQAPPTQLNLQQARDLQRRSINQRQSPPIKSTPPSPSVKVRKGKESEETEEESKGFFSAVFSSFYGSGKKSEPEVVESKPQQRAGTVPGQASTVSKAKLQTASSSKTYQQRAAGVPSRTGTATAKTIQQNTRIQAAAKPTAATAGKLTANAAARPIVKAAIRATAAATAKPILTATARTVPAASRSPATVAARPAAATARPVAAAARPATVAAGLKAPSAAAQHPTGQQHLKQQPQKVQATIVRNAPIINPMKFVPRPPVGFIHQQQHPANKKMSNIIQKPIVPRAALFTQHKPVAHPHQTNQRKH